MSKDTKQTEKKEAAAPVILLDNNILQKFLKKETSVHFQGLLQDIEKIGATLAISEIVLYESLKAIAFDDRKSGAVFEFINKYLTRYLVDDHLLMQAAKIHEIYGSDRDTKQRRDGISSEDIIIGTTAMMLGAYVLTCDSNDFPIPFFKESDRQVIYYQEGNKRKYVVMYLLEPDDIVISAALADLAHRS